MTFSFSGHIYSISYYSIVIITLIMIIPWANRWRKVCCHVSKNSLLLFGEFTVLPQSLFIVYGLSNLSANFLASVLVCLFEHGLENSILFLLCSESACGCEWQSQASHWPLLSSRGQLSCCVTPLKVFAEGLGLTCSELLSGGLLLNGTGEVCACV